MSITCLIFECLEQAQELLYSIETECARVCLRLNAKEAEFITLGLAPDHPTLRTTGGNALKKVSAFKYLGSSVSSAEQARNVKKALAWNDLNDKKGIYQSTISCLIKINFF